MYKVRHTWSACNVYIAIVCILYYIDSFRLIIAYRTEHSALRKLSATQLLPYLVKRMLGMTREDIEYFDYNEIKP